MSANPNIPVSSKRFYYLEGRNPAPRVQISVAGYEFIFGCDAELRPIRVAGPEHVHGQIKRTAHAHAAIEFRKQLSTTNAAAPRQ